jgi:hypothetical protein
MHRKPLSSRVGSRLVGICALAAWAGAAAAAAAETTARSTWPQPYTVSRDASSGILALRTPYYVFEQDLSRGGVITRIALEHGKAGNLLASPVETRIRTESGGVFSDALDRKPKVDHRRDGLHEIVKVDSALVDEQGTESGVRVETEFTYRWGYLKVHKVFRVPAGGIRVRELAPVATTLAPNLTNYGYREGRAEQDGASSFSFGSNIWGKLRPDHPSDKQLAMRYVPRSMLFADAGVEGLEWFAGSDLSQWELQCTGRRGQGMCRLQRSENPAGLALILAPAWSDDQAVPLADGCSFDYYFAVPLLEDRATSPWLHTSFNRNRGNWVSAQDIRGWADKGIRTAHCHNDGDYYGDGLFWRDGSYPPYPDMDRFDQVLKDCREAGVRTATYFSNKELHPSTDAFREHGDAWGRKNLKGDLQHNFLKPNSEFGVQMCLRSGWLDYLKMSIDRVLKNHPLDGVYYDWNVSLYCCNPLHEVSRPGVAEAQGHWDMDELLDLMEWTRLRVGPDGLVIIHNTTTPMFATENFADCVVATEWGYATWSDDAPPLADLPLEWSLVGSRRRGVISYGVLKPESPARLHRLFAIEALVAGVTPWPAGEDACELSKRLNVLGDFAAYRFRDWRNEAVSLSDPQTASAIYGRTGEAFILLANLDSRRRTVTCALRPDKLPVPLAEVHSATCVTFAGSAGALTGNTEVALDVRRIVGDGVEVELPGDDVVLLHIK